MSASKLKTFFFFLAALGCSSCVPALADTPSTDAPKLPAGHPVLPEGHPKMTHPDMTLFELISSGIAVHRGEFDYAYAALTDAAKKEKNAQIAAYAWEAAVASRNSSRLLEAADLWLTLDPNSEMALQTKLADAVDRNDKEDMAKALAAMDAALGANAKSDTQSNKPSKSEKAAKNKPQEPGAWLARVMRVFARTQKQGMDTFGELVAPYVEKYGNRPDVLMSLAQLKLASGNGPQACRIARDAIRKTPDDTQLTGEAADVCWGTDTRATRKLLTDFLKRNPNDPYIRLILGRVEQRLGRRDAALAALDRAMKHPKKDPKLFFNAGQLAADCANPVLAEKYYKSYIETLREESPEIDLSRLDVWLQLGNAALMQNAPARAAEYFSELTTGPFASQARLREALCLTDAGKVEEARRILQEARSTLPLDAPMFWGAEAKLLLEQNRPDEAYGVMLDAVKAFPNEPEILYEAAMIAEETGHSDKAHETLEHLLALNPNHVQANNALGYLLVEENTDLEKARELLERAYNAAPLDPFILDSMGWLCFREGKLKAAYEFTQASLKRLYDPEVELHLIAILASANRTAEAQRSLESFVKRNGITPEAAQAAETFKLTLPKEKDAAGNSNRAFMRSPAEALK